jgi:hypothetical protein
MGGELTASGGAGAGEVGAGRIPCVWGGEASSLRGEWRKGGRRGFLFVFSVFTWRKDSFLLCFSTVVGKIHRTSGHGHVRFFIRSFCYALKCPLYLDTQ